MNRCGIARVLVLVVVVIALGLPMGHGVGSTGEVRVTTEDFFPGDGFHSIVGPPPDVWGQNEPHIAQSPVNANLLAIGVNEFGTFGVTNDGWQSLHVSTDGGATWPFHKLIPGFPGDNSPEGLQSPIRGVEAATDPILAFDRRGNLFYAFATIQRTADRNEVTSVAVAKYTVNNRRERTPVTYAKTVVVDSVRVRGGRVEDKEFLAVDNRRSSPHQGNLYVCWTRFVDGEGHLRFAASSDAGETWRSVRIRRGDDMQGCSVTVAPNGDVYVAWRNFHAPRRAPNDDSTVMIARSTDGGRNFTAGQSVSTFADYSQVSSRTPAVFRTFALTWLAADGTASSYRVFLAWQERDPQHLTAGAQVAVWCSADRGNTWTELVRPHAHPLSHQIMPALAAANGKLSAGWYDSRSEPAYTPDGPVSGAGGAPGPGFGIDVFYNQRTSANCTAGWEGERRVTSQSFNPNLYASSTATRPFIGDYKGLAVDDRNVYVAWTDNRDINAAANALEDGTSSTNPPEIINLRSRDSNVYFKAFAK